MPELPEVETYRRQLEKALKGKTVKDVIARPDKIIFGVNGPQQVKKAFLGAKVKKCLRKGKYIWFEMSKKPWPVFHLGMTGSYMIADEAPDPKMKSVKLVLEMSDGRFMVFKDPRRFGRIFLLQDPVESKPLSQLGPDAYTQLPTAKKIYEMMHTKKAPIKAVLLDQSVLSGIGNWVADEVLFQAGIAPMRKANEITKKEYLKLRSKIKTVLARSVKTGADDEKYPKSWIFHHRWGKKGVKISSGEDIKHSVVGGRSTAWVPEKQT